MRYIIDIFLWFSLFNDNLSGWLENVVLFWSKSFFFPPSIFVFLTCTDWGCWSRQVENHRWPLPVEHCCNMLFYPFAQNKINSEFFGCWTVKTEKTCIYMSAKIYLRRTKLIPPFLLISFTFNLVVEYNFM